MRVALYARTSTADRQNPEVQLLEMRALSPQRGWVIVDEYVDMISGTRESRPALDKLLKESWKGKFQAVIITRLDRLGRSLSHLIHLLNDLSRHGVALVSIKEQIDLSTSNGRLLFHIFGAIGQFERDLIAERVKQGIAYAKYRGVKVGRPSTINSDKIEAAVKMRVHGLSIRAIAKSLGISPSGTHKLLAHVKTLTPEGCHKNSQVSLT